MKIHFVILFSIVLFFIYSCEKGDDDFLVKPQTCKVSISNFSFSGEDEVGGLKAKDIKRQKGTPENIDGYTVTVNNLEGKGVFPITETFKYGDSGANWGEITNVVEGRNEFIARSYGGTAYNGWFDIGYEGSGNNQKRLNKYKVQIDSKYPICAVYEGDRVVDIKSNRNNNINFNMKLVDGGRLAVVVGNRWWSVGSSYILVKVKGYSTKKLNKYRAACLIIDGDYKDLDITIECWRLGFFQYVLEKTLRIPQDFNIDLKCEKLKNKTRFIDVD